MKLYKSKLDSELFYYFNKNNEKRFCFRHRYYDELGKRKEKSKRGFTNEKEAYRSLLDVKTNVLNGDVKQVEHSNLTVAEWCDIWYETHKNDWKVTTRVQKEETIRIQIKPLLGNFKLSKLDKTTYKREFINVLLTKYNPSSVKLYHTIFKTAINAAIDDEILTRNRFNKIVIPQEDPNDNFLVADELNKLIAAANQHENETIYSLIYTLAYTGLRKGEALGLQWDNVNFEAKTITVERTRDTKGVRAPKTRNSYRTILIDDDVLSQLERYKVWCKKTKLSYGKQLKESDFVFTSPQSGEGISVSAVLYGLRRAIKKAKIKSITIHGLRHTHATLLISQRIPVKVIAERLGNTPQMIYEIYGHTFKELEVEAVTAFSDSLKQVGGNSGGTF
ncbi:tyrosine-type recombinase/integrase [Gracilibacillus sp. D59]|uniref:tyrosine-type recombinase/integrase n=1 Tax=Gracilibacillus sp. D59 TaxID=3457434 RepID=UPI003FCE2F2C